MNTAQTQIVRDKNRRKMEPYGFHLPFRKTFPMVSITAQS